MARMKSTPLEFLWESFRALIPALLVDVGGTLLLYSILVRAVPQSNVWPILGASMVPLFTNVANFVRRRTVDIVGLLVLVGIIAGLIPAAFGGDPRLMLIRESFVTGFLGLVLIVSGLVMRRPILYFVIREFLTANDALPAEHFNVLWRRRRFRREMRFLTLGWGVLLVGWLLFHWFLVLHLSVTLVLSVSPFISTTLMLLAGIGTAIWLGHGVSDALHKR
jgi:hypothetical protein